MSHPSAGGGRLIAYLVATGLILAFAGLYFVGRWQYQKEIDALNARVQQDRATVDKVDLALMNWRQTHVQSRNLTLADVAGFTMDGKARTARVDEDGRTEYWYVDPVTGGEAVIYHPNSARPPIRSLPQHWYFTVFMYRQLISLAGYVLWVPLYILFLATFRDATPGQRRSRLALLLFVAAASTVVAFLRERYWRDWDVFLDDVGPGFGEFQIIITLITMIGVRTSLSVPLAYLECPTCRYNLTGNVSGVCPECGTPVLSQP